MWYGKELPRPNVFAFWPGYLLVNILAGFATSLLVALAFNRLMKRDAEMFEQGLDPRPGPDRRFGLSVLLGLYICVAGAMGVVFWLHAEGQRTHGLGIMLAVAGFFGVFIVLIRRLELAFLYDKYDRFHDRD